MVTNADDLTIVDRSEQSKIEVEIKVLDESDENEIGEVKFPGETGSRRKVVPLSSIYTRNIYIITQTKSYLWKCPQNNRRKNIEYFTEQ